MLRGPMARLHRALAQFMLDLQTGEHGYQECYTPYIVNSSTLFGTGQLPKFKDDMFWVTKGGDDESAPDDQDRDGAREDLYLISTYEITLAGSVRDTITAKSDLPLKLTAHNPCFRTEAGSVGDAIRSMLSQPRFETTQMTTGEATD